MAPTKQDVPATDGHPGRLIAGATYWSTYKLSAEDHGGEAVEPLVLTDGDYGVRKQVASFDCLGLGESVPATCFPPACLSACTFDSALLRLMGQALGEECLAESVDVLLGPAVNVKRHPLGGRNFEYFSEDPLVTGVLARAYVAGVQSTGVGACVKHFAGNNQETNRMTSDSVIDDRALHELYLRAFEQVVCKEATGADVKPPQAAGRKSAPSAAAEPWQAGVGDTGSAACADVQYQEAEVQARAPVVAAEPLGARVQNTVPSACTRPCAGAVQEPGPGADFFAGQPAAIMTAYNRLNGTYCSQNAHLLQFARNTWGYRGIFVSDWGAMSQSIPSVAAGLDLCMPGPRLDHSATVAKAVEHGLLPASALEECEARIAHLMEHAQAIRQHVRRVPRQTQATMQPEQTQQTQQIQQVGELSENPLVGAQPVATTWPNVTARSEITTQPEAIAKSQGAAQAPADVQSPVTDRLAAVAHPQAAVQPIYDVADHLALAQVIAEQGAVLLKNEVPAGGTKSVLPLHPQQRLAVIGAFAKHPRYQGSGSARVNPVALDNTWDALQEGAEEHGFALAYAAGYDPASGDTTPALLDEALHCAQGADTVVLFVGLPECYESEGVDRTSLALPEGMNTLVDIVCAAGKPVVVVLQGGTVVELPWRDQVRALLLMYLPGCQGGHACANLLTGVVNPSGHLAESWPARVEDTALGTAYPAKTPQVMYTESMFVGYRYYTSAGVKPAYPFGFGLSYTSFTLAEGSICREGAKGEMAPWATPFNGVQAASNTEDTVTKGIEGAAENTGSFSKLVARCKVANTGEREGAEVVQVYVHARESAVPQPALVLSGFAKVFLAPGESAHVAITLDEHALGYWDTTAQAWRLNAGVYEFCIGTSSEDICLRETITIAAGQHVGMLVAQAPAPMPSALRCALAPYFTVKPHGFTQAAFRALYGKPIPALPPLRPFTPDSSVRDIQVTPLGRLIAYEIHKHGMAQQATNNPGTRRMMEAMLESMPLRNLATGGGSYSLVMALVDALNGHPVQALRTLFSHPETLIHELEEIPALEEGKL